MRIGSRIVIVGAIPIVIAAAIAVAAILLLQEANRARSGAALAGTVFRTLLTAVMARNEFLHAAPDGRATYEHRFQDVTSQAFDDLNRLRALQPGRDKATRNAQSTLESYVSDMRKLVGVTADNDRMIGTMRERAEALIGLTDQARERQHQSNSDLVRSLTEGDLKLRVGRDIVEAAYATRLAVAALASDISPIQAGAATALDDHRALFDVSRLTQVAGDLIQQLQNRRDNQFDTPTVGPQLLPRLETLSASLTAARAAGADPGTLRLLADFAHWSERIVKVYSAQYRSLGDAAAQLLTYSVQSHDTELATQNIAIELLKLSRQSTEALAQRDEATSRRVLASSQELSDGIGALPISPLIQSEMVDALATWRDGLQTATAGIAQQNLLMSNMDGASAAMIAAAQSLDDTFSENAERTARSIQEILIIGAATGLLLGGTAALLVARSITNPLVHLQTRITQLAQGQSDGLITTGGRRDELGDIARATNVFLVEIARRERALRGAKERADRALEDLRRTQAELVRAEKLASLGELVAGVAHEINTPIGIALTTATVIDEEARRFRVSMQDGRVSRSALDRMVDRVSEGANLLGANLVRAADLIHSFKHVAADQVSGERREFEVATFLRQLLTSLGPMLRKAGHAARVDCPREIVIDSYPGAIAQVVTNLVVNASLHAFDPGRPGLVTVRATLEDAETVRFVVSDDGRGIPPKYRAKVFDPFFTTRRGQGSTGLGLQIVFNLVTATLGGRIDLQSELGRGTDFIIDLPRVQRLGKRPVEEELQA